MRAPTDKLGANCALYEPKNVEAGREATARVTVELFRPPPPAPTP
jgi:hypothetical protein